MLTCRQKASRLYLEVSMLNLEELQQKDNVREPSGFHARPRAMKMAPRSCAISQELLKMCLVQRIYLQRSDCKTLGFIFGLYMVTNPK